MAARPLSANAYKLEATANPVSPNVFCADPTGVEYEGRLYIYGTNDHQQYEAVGDDGKNSYEHIKSLVIFSTDDMVNWEYHGCIDVGQIAPWIQNSWAPSIASRVEEDGLTHFYLYFSNSGCGVGVLTATHPLGPWSDPLGKPLVYQKMPGLTNCEAPFDPGVCIDEHGVGWLAFGGGKDEKGEGVYCDVPKIVRLGKDMLSFDSDFVSLHVPYFFEASELNYLDGTYIYTYSTDWQLRTGWDDPSVPAPGICSMGCMTSKTPLDPASWTFHGGFFLNAGDSGMDWCNNHTHLIEYQGQRYIIHHTGHIQERTVTKGGFRCMCVDKLLYTATHFPVTPATREGVPQTQFFDPFREHAASELFTCADVWYEDVALGRTAVKALKDGAWTFIKGADFAAGTQEIRLTAKGKGEIEVRLDTRDAEPIATVAVDSADFIPVHAALNGCTGIHDVYFAFFGEGLTLESWQAR